MNLRLHASDPLDGPTPLLVVPVPRGAGPLEGAAAAIDERLAGAFGRARESGDFRGGADDARLFYLPGEGGPERALFLGAGDRDKLDPEAIRQLGGRAVRQAEGLRLTALRIHLPRWAADAAGRASRAGGVGAAEVAAAAAEGAGLAAWDFRELKGPPDDPDSVRPLVEDVAVHSEAGAASELEAAIRVAGAAVEGECLARTLQWRPGNVATPSHLAATAEALAAEHGLGVTVLGPREMEEEGMGALLSVARGSEEEPRLIVLEHRGGGEGDPPLALVGKGLTFDTGGVSLKPAKGMEDMKYDMSGGAAVLGAMKAIALLEVPRNVVGIVPSSENHVSGRATKPGDVIRTRAGKTVEVINTDAEGRLILADALSYAVDRHAPEAIVDCATLTGAVVVALGNQAAAVMGTDEDLVAELRAAGDRSGERCWPLPLWDGYKKQLESPVADLRNVGGRQAGTITAGWFLAHFVGDVPWAHLDIAGTAYGEPTASYQRKGGFGFPTRLLLEWVRSRSA